MGILKLFKKPVQANSVQKHLKKEDFFAVGTYYYQNNIQKLACSNKEYRASAKTNIDNGLVLQKIYQYDYVNKPVKLVPEPKNSHDKNAIMIMIAGEKVGYIASEECLHVHHILKKCDVKFISAFIRGGKYKVVSFNGDAEKLEDDISIKIRIGYAE